MAEFSTAAFRQGPFTVEVGGHLYVFPALSAAQWLDTLAQPGWDTEVFRLCDDEAHEAFVERADNGEADRPELLRIVHLAVAEAGGRNWWEVTRLAGICLGQPSFLGSILLRGIDPSRCTLAAFLAVAWSLITQNGTEMEHAQREMELTTPPPEALEEEQPEPVSMEDLVARMRAAPGVSTR